MGAWTDAVETKARIIHEQLSAAQALARSNGVNVDQVSQPYYELLRRLYSEEFTFADLADTSDLVARFSGPAVAGADPTVSIVTSVFTDLRNQIRGIARAIVGLTSDRRVRWPSELDPHLSGIAHGSLVVGISVPPPDEHDFAAQMGIPGFSDQVFDSVRSAVRSLGTVAQHIRDNQIKDSIDEAIPDPAVRDTVLVAASRLAPSGRRGIDSLILYGPERTGREPGVLTPKSRQLLNRELAQPVRVSGTGTFEGVVREIDLDARRFELRRVQNAGAIRCVYDYTHHDLVRTILDAQVRISGTYEARKQEQPRLLQLTELEVIRSPADQLLLELPDDIKQLKKLD